MLHTQEIVKGVRKITRYSKSKNALSHRMRFLGNDTTAFRPEVWANESVRLLWEKMVYAGTVHRDFDNEIAEFGEIVNTRQVGNFTTKRKQNDLDTLADQDATATKIQVKLNQRAYNSFVLGDGDRTKSFKDLFQIYLEPAMGAMARFLDQCIGGQVYQFLGNVTGGLGSLSSTTGHNYLLDARQKMNDNRAPDDNRHMGLCSASETMMQKVDIFKSAEKRGDGGRALTNALLGRVAGFNNFLSLNTPSVRGATKGTATTTSSASSAGGLVVNVTSAAVTLAGVYYTVVGDMTPLRVASVSSTALTNTRALLNDVANGAAVQPYSTGLINQGSAIAAGDTTVGVNDGYPSGWMGPIVVDGTGVPKQGQLVAFKAAGGTVYSPEYCVVQATATSIVLDRPLETTLADNDIVCYGPNGDFNFGYCKDALTLVNRPLALPEAGTGARAAVAEFNSMSLRVTFSYDGAKQGTRCTVDGLFGLKVLDTNQGTVMLG